MPPRQPLDMPVQPLDVAPPCSLPPPDQPDTPVLSRFWLITLSAALLAYGTHEIYRVVEVGGVTVLEAGFVALFAITFGWIAQACATAIVGLFSARRSGGGQDTGHGRLTTRTALVMPVYNENPVSTAAALQAMAINLKELGHADAFEIVVLSDTNSADPWVRETAAYLHLRSSLNDVMPVWYRRRWANTARKAGNVADFITGWGARYDFFIVLDADSVMSGDLIVSMIRRMEDDPRIGILQSVPMLAGGSTLYARLQQFAGWAYGPVVARGLSAWSGRDGNYWGHNAAIRTEAFAGAAGLPELRGRRPIGGHIMSHDFVEAALIRRAGWDVIMLPEDEGSYEDSPPSLTDVADRDRRWAQGNLQHLGVISAAGLAFPSRVHFATGIMSYLSSVLWLWLLVIGFMLTLQAFYVRPEYFSQDYQLYPTWPVFDAERMRALFGFTMAILFLPKTIGIGRLLVSARRRKAAGGPVKLLASATLELLLSALYAPIMMLTQSRQIYEIVTGQDSGWKSQRREAGGDSWATIWQRHKWHMITGVVVTLVVFQLEPTLVAWMSPALAGLILSGPLSWISGRAVAGQALARAGILQTGMEHDVPAIIARRDEIARDWPVVPEDALAWLAANAPAAEAHIAFNQPPPDAVPGHPDADFMTATAKLQDAHSLGDALAWLTTSERVRVCARPDLLQRMNVLASQPPAHRP